jgi:hypothetical protein
LSWNGTAHEHRPFLANQPIRKILKA